MKALCISGPKILEVKEIDRPKLSEGMAIVKIVKCGICGSDVTAYKGVNPTMKYPITGIGHEGVGIIEEIAENDKGLKVGDRVTLEPYIPCNSCHMCKIGRFNNCADIRVCGVHKDGMMMEYFEQPIAQIYKLPDEMSFDRAVLVEPLTIGLHALQRARVIKDENVVIFGAGIIGLMAALGAINYGATPILIDIVEERLEYAKELGVKHIYNSKDGKIIEFLQDVTNNKLPEVMIDCTGAIPILEKMHEYVCHGGRVALVGWPHEPVKLNTVRLMQKEIDVLPSRNSNSKFPLAIELVLNNKVPADKLITKNVSLDEVENTLLDMIKSPSDYLKVIVDIAKED